MNIGIITFHNAHNYGAVLQCYALQTYLIQLGHDVSVINYRNNELLKCYKVFDVDRIWSKNPFKLIRNLRKELSVYSVRKKRNRNFNAFIEERLRLVEQETILSGVLDYIVIGSDQVWNIGLTGGFDKYYWGGFGHSSRTKIISYAASVEKKWPDESDVVAKNFLSKFSAISVREGNIAQIIRGYQLKAPVCVSVDPTMLLDMKSWEVMVEKPNIDGPYLLLYQVRLSDKAYEIAKSIAESKHLKLVCLSARVDGVNTKEISGASPNLFLGLFRYAEHVVCTSFHGCVFSVVFQRPFYSVRLNDGKDERAENLLHSLGLESRIVESGNPCDFSEDICWTDVEHRLETLSTDSKNYLINNIV